jgi:hypothetical protein
MVYEGAAHTQIVIQECGRISTIRPDAADMSCGMDDCIGFQLFEHLRDRALLREIVACSSQSDDFVCYAIVSEHIADPGTEEPCSAGDDNASKQHHLSYASTDHAVKSVFPNQSLRQSFSSSLKSISICNQMLKPSRTAPGSRFEEVSIPQGGYEYYHVTGPQQAGVRNLIGVLLSGEALSTTNLPRGIM